MSDLAKPAAGDHLTALPAEMQEQLARIARRAAGLSAREKAAARLVFGSTAANLAAFGADDTIDAAEMVSALAVIVDIADRLARQSSKGGTHGRP